MAELLLHSSKAIPIDNAEWQMTMYMVMTLWRNLGMLRFVAGAIIAVFAAQFPSTTWAATVQYDLTLTPRIGSIGGSGYFDVSAPVNGSGVDAITALSISIDGQQFTLANDPTATATFSGGALTSINYAGGGW